MLHPVCRTIDVLIKKNQFYLDCINPWIIAFRQYTISFFVIHLFSILFRNKKHRKLFLLFYLKNRNHQIDNPKIQIHASSITDHRKTDHFADFGSTGIVVFTSIRNKQADKPNIYIYEDYTKSIIQFYKYSLLRKYKMKYEEYSVRC